MIVFVLSISLLLITPILSLAVESCSDQASCITIEIRDPVQCPDQNGKCIDICLTHQCKNGEDPISHGCPNIGGNPLIKWEAWYDNDPTDNVPEECTPHPVPEGCTDTVPMECDPSAHTSCMCHFDVRCDKEKAQADRWVEFAVKDGSGCSAVVENGEDYEVVTDEMTFDESIDELIDQVTCRVQDAEGDVKCEPTTDHGDCIHRIYYQCPQDPTDAPITDDEGPIPTCELQAPCLEFDIAYPTEENAVKVTVTYNSALPGCIKEDDEEISHVCFNVNDGVEFDIIDANGNVLSDAEVQSLIESESEDTSSASGSSSPSSSGERRRTLSDVETAKIDGFESGWSIEEVFPCDCPDGELEGSVQMVGFKDSSGCGEPVEPYPTTAGVTCESGVGDDFCQGGNDQQCVYTVQYTCCHPEQTEDCCNPVVGAYVVHMMADGQSDMSVFGLENVSSGEAAGIYSGIAVGCIVLVAVMVGMVWFCVAKAKARRVIEQQMEVVETNATQSPVAEANDVTQENDDHVMMMM